MPTTNPIVPFDFSLVTVRTLMRDGEPWFVGRDVAAMLGYMNPNRAVTDHCKCDTKTVLPSFRGDQETLIIPERDVYRLIMRSKLPAAEAFEE